MPDCASGDVRLVAGVTGENTAPVPADQSQSSRSLVTLLGGDAVVEQRPGQPAELKIRTAKALKPVSGSVIPQFSAVLLNATVATMPVFGTADDDGSARRITAASAALAAFKPADEIEGMIAAQAVALHSAGMECLRRATLREQPAELASRLRKDGAKLLRCGTANVGCTVGSAPARGRLKGWHVSGRLARSMGCVRRQRMRCAGWCVI